MPSHGHVIQGTPHDHGIQPPPGTQAWGSAQQNSIVIGNQFGAQAKQKPANPKQAYGDKKPPLHLIHAIAQLHESAALHSGRRKYGENNYLKSEVEAMTYVGAMLRHIQQWVSGANYDPTELVHHLGAVRACTNILLTAEATGMLIDNRPLSGMGQHLAMNNAPVSYCVATQRTFAKVEATIEHLNRLYPDPAK